MKDSIDNNEGGQQLADYRIKETQVTHVISFTEQYYYVLQFIQYSALSRRFRNIMDEYNGALESFREKNKDCIVKQLEYGGCMQAND